MVRTDEGTALKLGDDFRAKKAPDLKIFLSSLEYNEINEDNASDPKTSILIGLLTKFKGKSQILLPSSVNPSDYKSIVVHCVKYAEFWGGSDIK